MTPAGFPHSDISGSTSARDSPKLFAACHVLHRLLAPRHPPSALCSLTTTATHQAVCCCVARDTPCTQLGEIEDLQFAETYPVVKVRPRANETSACDLDRILANPASSDPLVGGSIPTDQGSDVGVDKTTARSRRAIASRALPSSSLRLCASLFTCGARVAKVVETRRLELLTLSLQRRCSAS